MSTHRLAPLLITVLAPILWGATYIVFSQTLPTDHPLLVGALRALPAGLLLMALGPGLPPRALAPRLLALGAVNIGVFFALLFIAAARLPGGIAATITSTQPLIVALLAWPMLGRRPVGWQLVAACAGIAGVGLLVLSPQARLDGWGVLAAIAAATSMATGTVLIERWGRLGPPLALTAWQLTFGGAALLPAALWIEGVPAAPTGLNALGMAYLVLAGTALAYWLWVRGIAAIGADAAFLVLLSPLVATALGALTLGEWFSPAQWAGGALILGSTLAGVLLSRRRRAG